MAEIPAEWKVKLDLDMSKFNDAIAKAKKLIQELIELYKEALELQQKLKQGEDDGNSSDNEKV